MVERVVLPLTALQAWVPRDALAWNAPAWSLSVEATLYLLFPLAFARLNRCESSRLWRLIAGAWLLALSVVAAYLIASPDGIAAPAADDRAFWLNAIRWSPLPHVPVFLMGVAGGILYRRGARLRRPTLTAWGVTAAGGSVLLGGTHSPYLWLANGLLAPASLALIFAVAALRPRPLEHPALVRLGEASYVLYITHQPLWLFWLSPLLAGEAAAVGSPFVLVEALVFLLCIALLLHRLEVRWTSRLRGLRQRNPSVRSEGHGTPSASIDPSGAGLQDETAGARA